MSLYANYLKERTDKQILEDERGFAVYSFTQDSVYIEDIYTHPEHRFSGVAASFADQIAGIARDKGIHKMLGSICPTAKNSTDGMKVLFAYGFKLDSSINNFILLSKDI